MVQYVVLHQKETEIVILKVYVIKMCLTQVLLEKHPF